MTTTPWWSKTEERDIKRKAAILKAIGWTRCRWSSASWLSASPRGTSWT